MVNPIKQGQRREGMASDVVTSIVSSECVRTRDTADRAASPRSHASGNTTALRDQEDQKAHSG